MTPLEPQDIPWAWVRQGLDEVIRKTRPTWTVADVFLALQKKHAVLFVLGEREGFAVLQTMPDFAGQYLFVWVLWGALNARRHEVMADLRKLAISLGCKRLEMRSPRRWEAADLGWTPVETVYRANLWPED